MNVQYANVTSRKKQAVRGFCQDITAQKELVFYTRVDKLQLLGDKNDWERRPANCLRNRQNHKSRTITTCQFTVENLSEQSDACADNCKETSERRAKQHHARRALSIVHEHASYEHDFICDDDAPHLSTISRLARRTHQPMKLKHQNEQHRRGEHPL